MLKKQVTLLMLACIAASAFCADVSVPSLSLLTNGRLNEFGLFELSTRASIDMLIEGGSKFDAWFKLGFRSSVVEDYLKAEAYHASLPAGYGIDDVAASVSRLEAASGISLRTIAIQVKNLAGTPLQLSTFVGHLDTFCSGPDFTTYFGENDFGTKFRGYMYYPEGIGGDPNRSYDGIHEVYGTGIRLGLPLQGSRYFLYAYQDSLLGAGHYSLDARALLNLTRVKIEAFAGASLPESTAGIYRAGILFYFDTGAIGDFYALIGVPRWDPSEAFGMDLFYFMFEPRVRFDGGELVLSLFFHPAWYLQKATNESGALEFRFDLGFGKAVDGSIRAGTEMELSYNPNLDTKTLTLDAAPYVQMVRNGIQWDLRLSLRGFPFPDPWYGMFMPTLGVSTAF